MIVIGTTDNFLYGINPGHHRRQRPGRRCARARDGSGCDLRSRFPEIADPLCRARRLRPHKPRQRKHRYQHRRQKLEGWNNGYQHGDGRSEIQIVPFAGDPNADPSVRAVFVVEMSAIFMTYRNKLMGPTWIENYSTGEALSSICVAELHPEGYFPPSPVGAPRIWQWSNVPAIIPGGAQNAR